MNQEKYRVMGLYIGKDDDVFQRYEKLAKTLGGAVSMSSLIRAAAALCIDELETKAPQFRKFTVKIEKEVML